MKFIYKNLEIIICLIIMLFMFTSLVLFYTSKIESIKSEYTLNDDLYFNDDDNNYVVEILYKEKISDNYIKVLDLNNNIESVLYLKKSFINRLELNKKYSIKIEKKMEQKILKTQLQKLFSDSVIREVKEETK